MFKEFKKFIMRGNMIDLAVGVIIGGAFNGLVNSLVNDIFMPLIGFFIGDTDFSNFYLLMSKLPYDTVDSTGATISVMEKPETLARAQELGLSTLNYGNFITGVINFLIMALVVFLMVKGINKLHDLGKKPVAEEAVAPTTKICPYCQSEISIKAVKCPHCTSDLE